MHCWPCKVVQNFTIPHCSAGPEIRIFLYSQSLYLPLPLSLFLPSLPYSLFILLLLFSLLPSPLYPFPGAPTPKCS